MLIVRKTSAFAAEKLTVPTVTLVVMLCEVMPGTLGKSPKFAIVPAAFGTSVPFPPRITVETPLLAGTYPILCSRESECAVEARRCEKGGARDDMDIDIFRQESI